jgi:replicative DNA helicase
MKIENAWLTEHLEANVLGGMMLDGATAGEVFSRLTVKDFTRWQSQALFDAMREVYGQDRCLTPAAVYMALEARNKDKTPELLSGLYVLDLVDLVKFAPILLPHDVILYCDILKQRTARREAAAVAHTLGLELETDVDHDPIDRAVERLRGLVTQPDGSVGGVMDDPDEFFQQLEGHTPTVPALHMGWPRFDETTGGFRSQELIILAARPSMGKTTLALNVAWKQARAGHEVFFVSLETTAAQIRNKAVSWLTGVPIMRIQKGACDAEEIARCVEAASEIKRWPFTVADLPRLEIGKFRPMLQRHALTHGLKFIVLDHLHQVSLPGRERNDLEIASVVAECKELAREFEVPFLLCAQLNRALEGREDKRPQVSDLRGSGAIEEKADVLLFLHRQGYYDRANPAIQNDAEVLVAKNRNNDTGHVKLDFDRYRAKFKEVKE